MLICKDYAPDLTLSEKLSNEEKRLYGLSELVDFTSEVHRMRHILATVGILSYTLWIETN